MAKECKSERASARQRSIEDGLLLLLRSRDYADISVSDLCTALPIPRRTFYHYFDNKDDVLDAALDHLVGESMLAVMFDFTNGLSGIESSFTRYFRYWRDRRSAELAALIRSGLTGKMLQRTQQWIEREQSGFPMPISALAEMRMVATIFGLTGVMSVLFYWCAGGFQEPPEKLASYVTLLLSNPLYSAK